MGSTGMGERGGQYRNGGEGWAVQEGMRRVGSTGRWEMGRQHMKG